MSIPITSHNKADAISICVLVLGIGIIAFLGTWWPDLLLVIGIALILRQYLRGRHYDMAITAVLFGGLFAYYKFEVGWNVLMPVLFTLGAIYIIFREYFVTKERVGKDQIEDAVTEIEDEEEKHGHGNEKHE